MVPEHIREAFKKCAIGTHPYAWEIVANWFDSLPKLPEVPWDQADDDATHHVYNPFGEGLWVRNYMPDLEMEVCDEPTTSIGWYHTILCGYSGLRLPTKFDWRDKDTIEERPSSQAHEETL